MTYVYLIGQIVYNDATNAADTKVIAAFAKEDAANAEAERLDAASLGAWIGRTGGAADVDNIRTQYEVSRMRLTE